jgi:hypothetical protein
MEGLQEAEPESPDDLSSKINQKVWTTAKVTQN